MFENFISDLINGILVTVFLSVITFCFKIIYDLISTRLKDFDISGIWMSALSGPDGMKAVDIIRIKQKGTRIFVKQQVINSKYNDKKIYKGKGIIQSTKVTYFYYDAKNKNSRQIGCANFEIKDLFLCESYLDGWYYEISLNSGSANKYVLLQLNERFNKMLYLKLLLRFTLNLKVFKGYEDAHNVMEKYIYDDITKHF